MVADKQFQLQKMIETDSTMHFIIKSFKCWDMGIVAWVMTLDDP
jgi:hypothetical protein